jgi:DnaK suppressor protein
VTGKKTPPKKVTAAPPAKAPVKGKTVGSASAAAILGRPQAKSGKGGSAGNAWTPVSKVKPEWQKFYQNLLELHERLRNQMSGLAKESQTEMENYSLHMGDSGTDNFDRDFALSLLSSDQDAIYEIEEALKRIEKGTYGVCELTQKPIPKARLEAIPWTRFTVEAQAQLEKEGALKQRNRLGSLGSVETGSGPDGDDDDGEVEEKPAKEKES